MSWRFRAVVQSQGVPGARDTFPSLGENAEQIGMPREGNSLLGGEVETSFEAGNGNEAKGSGCRLFFWKSGAG